MTLSSFRKNASPESRLPLPAASPRPWPVDPELNRRVVETRAGIERMRRELARHVLPERKRGQEQAEAAHPRMRLRAT